MVDHPKNLTVDEGANATFTCKTKGYPSTQAHMWQFNGGRISGANCSGCHIATFTKPYVKKTDAGWYSCTGRNILGEGPPALAYLTVKCKYQCVGSYSFPFCLTVLKRNYLTCRRREQF